MENGRHKEPKRDTQIQNQTTDVILNFVFYSTENSIKNRRLISSALKSICFARLTTKIEFSGWISGDVKMERPVHQAGIGCPARCKALSQYVVATLFVYDLVAKCQDRPPITDRFCSRKICILCRCVPSCFSELSFPAVNLTGAGIHRYGWFRTKYI